MRDFSLFRAPLPRFKTTRGGGGGDGCNKKMMQKIPFEFVWQCLFTFLYSIIRKVITFFFGAKTVTFSGSCQGAGKYIKKTAY